MTEPTYEYRVLDRRGERWADWPTLEQAKQAVEYDNGAWFFQGPFRIQRRLVTPWEDCDE